MSHSTIREASERTFLDAALLTMRLRSCGKITERFLQNVLCVGIIRLEKYNEVDLDELMTASDQIARHEREIGELRGQLGALATKEFVRRVIQEQTNELNQKFDAIDDRLNEISERQQRFKGIGQAITFGLPFLVSALALVAVLLK